MGWSWARRYGWNSSSGILAYTAKECPGRLTVCGRLDLGDRHDLLDMFRLEVGNTETGTLQCSVLDESLKNLPELADLALLGHVGSVDEKQIGWTAEFVDGGLD
jgi:hypothetical protein